MFDNLIESQAKRKNTLGQTITSVIVHAVLILAAVKATQGIAEAAEEKPIDTTVVFLKPPAETPPPEPPKPQDVVVSANPPPKGFQTVVAPTDIPKDIPPVNLNQKAFDPRDFTGKGVEGGVATGIVGGTGPVDVGSVVVSANPPPKGFQTVVAPTDIPKDIPPVNLNQKAFDPRDFTGKGVEGGVSTGIIGGTGPVDVGSVVVTSAEADEPPRMLTPGPLRTPSGFEGVPGRVMLTFIVDTLGRAEPPSVKVVSSTNKVFEEPAKDVILKANFKPGRNGGRTVRVLVQQPVVFQGQ